MKMKQMKRKMINNQMIPKKVVCLKNSQVKKFPMKSKMLLIMS